MRHDPRTLLVTVNYGGYTVRDTVYEVLNKGGRWGLVGVFEDVSFRIKPVKCLFL